MLIKCTTKAKLSSVALWFAVAFNLVLVTGCEKPENDIAPSIIIQPVNDTVTVGETALFTVGAKGTSPLLYQWYRNGITIDGATDSSYTTPATILENSGDNYTVRVKNKAGHATSDPAILIVNEDLPQVISFTTEGSTFSPVIGVEGNPIVLWTWADGTTGSSLTPTKDYGSTASRVNTLQVTPWSALKSINIGYDAGDGGSYEITMVPDQHVSLVEGLDNVAPYLEVWCSSYNQIPSLDFSNFINLHTIECFLSSSLVSVNLSNTTALRRACFEDCNLQSLDLSQSPALEDLRGAMNAYSTINFGTIGSHVWHICVRDNPQITNTGIFQDMTQFPEIAELFIWNDNQSGSLRIPSTSSENVVSILCDGNHYTSIDLSGSLLIEDNVGVVEFRNNNLTHINILGCGQINALQLENNALSEDEVDSLLATLDYLGRNRELTPEWASLIVNVNGNAAPSQKGYSHAVNLAAKGWTIVTSAWTLEPGAPAETGEARIDFVTSGNTTSMRCDFSGTPAATWHWSDGTTSTGVSGQDVSKTGLGEGTHSHYLIISNGAALSRFGATSGGGNGNLVSISDFTNSPYLRIIYVYAESLFTFLGRTNTTRVKEYHLMSTGLSPASMDQIFTDAVASNVYNGIMYCNNTGTSASDTDRATLTERGWSLY